MEQKISFVRKVSRVPPVSVEFRTGFPLIRLTDKDRMRSKTYVVDRAASRRGYACYNDCMQLDNTLKQKQDLFGKLGECVAWKTLMAYGVEVASPDFEVYEVGRKSWSPDLPGSASDFGVKTAMDDGSVETHEDWSFPSWIFQDSIAGRKDVEVFGDGGSSRNLKFVFVVVHGDMTHGKVFAVVGVEDLHGGGLFQDPFMSKYKGFKKAVYFRGMGINTLFNTGLANGVKGLIRSAR